MFLSAINTYEEDETPVSEFHKGETVYKDGQVYGVVSKATFQPLTRVFMYEFKDKGFACSALGLSSTKNGKGYRLGEIMQVNRSLDTIMDDMFHSFNKNGQGSLNGAYDITGTHHALEFFQPDGEFVKWIHEYAANRMIIDVGCGGGRLVGYLKDYCNAKVCGVDPFFDISALQKYNMSRIMRNLDMVHFFDKKIEDMGSLFQGSGDKVLLLFARPCHSNFVENTLKMKDVTTEALYITKPENVENYNDLGKFDNKKILVPHKGFSVENEVVYSIK